MPSPKARAPFPSRHNKAALFSALLTAGYCTFSEAAPARDHISMAEAIATAEQSANAYASKAELVCTEKPCVYVVDLVDGTGANKKIRIDAHSGQILPDPTQASAAATAPAENGQGLVWVKKRSVSLELSAGQIAGMGNTILNPTASLGLQLDLGVKSMPQWDNQIQFYGIYGKVQTNDGTSTSKPQEWRSRLSSIYNYYEGSDISKGGVGLYAELAHGFSHYSRYTPPLASTVYAAEEDDKLFQENLFGIDFKFSVAHDRIESQVHNIIFLSGSRIAPNLLTYQPLIGVMWNNTFHILGNMDHPKLSLLTDMEFYFARKAGVALFNSHDFLGGTKREIYLSYGLAYNYDPETTFTLRTFGYNNLNRGSSDSTPFGFRDGLTVGFIRQF